MEVFMNRKSLKESAKRALKGNWAIAIVAMLIASIFGAGTIGNINFDFNVNLGNSNSEALEGTAFEDILAQIEPFMEQYGNAILAFFAGFAALGAVFSIVMFFLASIINVGYHKFNLDLVDGHTISIGTLFNYFKHWKSAILASFLVNLFTSLWMLLCIIPGIVAAYKYAMVPFILAEDPDIAPREAIRKSTEMMRGHKWQLFCLSLSFIGWSILCAFTCGIGFLWLNPYINATMANFYREVSGTNY
jgi:uncharacterized membrane protein